MQRRVPSSRTTKTERLPRPALMLSDVSCPGRSLSVHAALPQEEISLQYTIVAVDGVLLTIFGANSFSVESLMVHPARTHVAAVADKLRTTHLTRPNLVRTWWPVGWSSAQECHPGRVTSHRLSGADARGRRSRRERSPRYNRGSWQPAGPSPATRPRESQFPWPHPAPR
jgi:hypothetical protein